MDWDSDVSSLSRTWMRFLGDFGPTVDERRKMLKGYMHDDDGGNSVYLDSGELRELASSCNEVADWLDRRAEGAPKNV